MTETEWLVTVGRRLVDPIRCEELVRVLEQQIGEKEAELTGLRRQLAVVQKFFPPPLVAPAEDLRAVDFTCRDGTTDELFGRGSERGLDGGPVEPTATPRAVGEQTIVVRAVTAPPTATVLDQPSRRRRAYVRRSEDEKTERRCLVAARLYSVRKPQRLSQLLEVVPLPKSSLRDLLRHPWFQNDKGCYRLTAEGLQATARIVGEVNGTGAYAP